MSLAIWSIAARKDAGSGSGGAKSAGETASPVARAKARMSTSIVARSTILSRLSAAPPMTKMAKCSPRASQFTERLERSCGGFAILKGHW